MKQCERCGVEPAKKGERFCKECRKQVLSELKEARYLAPILPHSGVMRTSEQKENVYETKHGTGHG